MYHLIQWKAGMFAVALVAFSGTTVMAQSAPVIPESGEQDPGGWNSGEAGRPNLNEPAPATPPVLPPANTSAQPPSAPAPAADGPGTIDPTTGRVRLTEDERRKAARNRKAAISSLNGLLEDRTTDYKTVKKRVTNLKQLIKKYETQLASSASRKQQMQVELFRRTLTLKQQFDAGRVPKAVYEKRLAEENQRYVSDKSRLERDIKFNSAELAQLRPKLADLESRLQTMQITRPELKKINRPKPSPAQQLLGKVDKTLRGLVDFKVKGSLGNSRLDGHP